MSLLRWTSKSSTKLADELVRKGFEVSSRTVLRLLHQLGYSLQANAKVTEGRQHADRDAQFRYLNDMASAFVEDGQPVISVDTKKKELIGDYANGGVEWAPAGEPERTQVHDFVDPGLGKAIPYGIYDLVNNEGWVSVGDTADTAEFAVESIRRWWNQMGRARFPDADRLMITADAGGSNGYRLRAWKVYLAALAAETGLRITVCHYPPGTSKWNRIEHRMFSFITANWHDHRSDLLDHDDDRPDDPGWPRPELVPDRSASHRRRTPHCSPEPARLARRLELHHRRPIRRGVNPKRC